MDLKKYIAEVQDYPKPGISFKDITPLIGNGDAFKYATKKFSEFAQKQGADIIVGPDARGFIFGCPVSYEMGIGFVPVRKPNKLPREVLSFDYDLEYGSNTLCIHKDAIKPGQKVVIVDDLLATGGTMHATIELIKQLGGEVVGLSFLIELSFLDGRKKIGDYPIQTLINY